MSAVAETLEQIDREVAERVDRGKCGCGCEKDLPQSRRRGSMFISKAHHQRVYRRRVEAACVAVGQPCRLNLQLALTTGPTSNVHGGRKNGSRAAERASKPSGLQVPYRKAVDVLADQLAGVRVPASHARARVVVENALRAALPARQRERLEAGEQLRDAA